MEELIINACMEGYKLEIEPKGQKVLLTVSKQVCSMIYRVQREYPMEAFRILSHHALKLHVQQSYSQLKNQISG